MHMKVTFVGSSDYIPTQQRNPKPVHVQRGGDAHLFDIGEGTVRQMMKYNLTLNVSNIFLSGTRYDHTGGLPGLLKTYDSTHISREEDVNVFTPYGTGNDIENIAYVFDDFNFDVEIHEVTPRTVVDNGEYEIRAFETDSSETSVGYSLVESSRRGRFDREKAESLGVPPGPKFSELTQGNPVDNQDGDTIRPEQVLGKRRPGRRIIYTGDTRPTDSVIEASRHADLLIHDSALAEDWNERAVETGHSTALEAATVAKKANAKRLALVGISPKFTGLGFRLRQEAESVYAGEVIVAEDGITVDVPYPDSDSDANVGYESRSAESMYSVGRRSQELRNHIQAFRDVVNSGYLDEFSQFDELSSAIDELVSSIDNAVMVLGSYEGRHSDELEELKSELNELGYDANSATDLPSHENKSLEQNISFYMMLSRFCIMVDREPSGHLNEYEIARRQRNILIRLVPEDGGSTYMTEGDEGININYIKSFEFKYDPTEVLKNAIDWAEQLLEERKEAYQERYPWREED